MQIKVKKLTPEAKLPVKATPGSSGFDLCAAAPATIAPGQFVLVSTGLTFELPSDTELQIRPRSGLAAKYGVTVLNSPGTVDNDYRGEVKVILINHGTGVFHVNAGDRIAQAVPAALSRDGGFGISPYTMIEVSEVDETDRGAGGFGSTGVK